MIEEIINSIAIIIIILYINNKFKKSALDIIFCMILTMMLYIFIVTIIEELVKINYPMLISFSNNIKIISFDSTFISCELYLTNFAWMLLIFFNLPLFCIIFPIIKLSLNRKTIIVDIIIYLAFLAFVIYYFNLIEFINNSSMEFKVSVAIEYISVFILMLFLKKAKCATF